VVSMISLHVRGLIGASLPLCLQRDRRVNPTKQVAAQKALPSAGIGPTNARATAVKSCANNMGRP